MASWIAVAPEAQAVVSEIGEPLGAEGFGEAFADRAEQAVDAVGAVERAARRDQVVV